MSIPKSFLDLMGTLALGRAGTPVVIQSGFLPDNDWTRIEIGPLINGGMQADKFGSGGVDIAADSGASQHFYILVTAEPTVFPFSQQMGAGSYVYAKAETGVSGSGLSIFGWRPEGKS